MTTTPERHPDIEIYLHNQSVDAIQDWLSQRFDACDLRKRLSKTNYALEVTLGALSIPVLVVEKAAGGYTSLWFDSAATPWATDQECAREAFAHFDTEIRCILNGWQEGDEPDEWWSISNQGEREIRWQG